MGAILLQLTIQLAVLWAATALLWTGFRKGKHLSAASKRLIAGLVYGVLAALSSHFGVSYLDMILNVRDVAPLIAGMLFDPWAGVMAGVIGAADRFVLGHFLGVGEFTHVACALATFVAGLMPIVLQKTLLENGKPRLFHGFAVGVLVEDFHMLMVLFTHMDNLPKAYNVVSVCAIPMMLCVAVGVTVAVAIVRALSGELKWSTLAYSRERRPITNTFQHRLLAFVLVVMACTFGFSVVNQTDLTESTMQSILTLNAQDLRVEFERSMENKQSTERLIRKQALIAAKAVAAEIQDEELPSHGELQKLASEFGLYEIAVVGSDGRIKASTNVAYLDFDMASGAQSAAFLSLLEGTRTEMVQGFQSTTFNPSLSILYAAVRWHDGFVQVGYDSDSVKEYQSLADVTSIATNRHIEETGFVLLVDATGKIVGGEYEGRTLAELGSAEPLNDDVFTVRELDGERYYCLELAMDSYFAVLAVPVADMYWDRDVFAYEIALVEALLFGAIYLMINGMVGRIVIVNLHKVNAALARITAGDLDTVVDVREGGEFTALSDDINATVGTLKRYIKQAEERMAGELVLGRDIQRSALPNPLPQREEFRLAASMNAAKEVGGDFYDTFYLGQDRLAMVIADVSGKGVPAAMFMMRSKTMLKGLARSAERSPAEILSAANAQLIEGNQADMFVTAWMGILEISKGVLHCANAGHEYPAIARHGQPFELLKDKHGLVLAAMPDIRYKEYTIELHRGDTLFVYTDGVTEATDADNQLFGEQRMLDALNAATADTPEARVEAVHRGIDAFVGSAPQFDDMTMLCLRYEAEPPHRVELPAREDQVPTAQDFVTELARAEGADARECGKLELVTEEIFLNVANYAYGNREGTCAVECGATSTGLRVCFVDNGTPYDPLQKPDPNVTLSAEERSIGGLGVFLCKKLTDRASYVYENGQNRLTIEMNLTAKARK